MKSKETALAKATVIGTLAKVLDLLCMEMSAGAEQSSLLVSEAGPAEKKPLLSYAVSETVCSCLKGSYKALEKKKSLQVSAKQVSTFFVLGAWRAPSTLLPLAD